MSKGKKLALICAVAFLLLPVWMQCGHLFYGCATAPDGSETYYTSYEVEPLGITLVETLIGVNLRIYYWRGEDAHFIGS